MRNQGNRDNDFTWTHLIRAFYQKSQDCEYFGHPVYKTGLEKRLITGEKKSVMVWFKVNSVKSKSELLKRQIFKVTARQ